MNRTRSNSRTSSTQHRVRGRRPAQRPTGFISDDEALEKILELIQHRRKVAMMAGESGADRQDLRLRQDLATQERNWHAALRSAGPAVALGRCCKRHRLNGVEREILAALILQQLGLLPRCASSCAEILDSLRLPPRKALAALRTLSEHGRLYKAKLISFDDPDNDIPQREPMVDPALVETILARQPQDERGWKVTSESELYDHLQSLTRVLAKKSESRSETSMGRLTAESLKWTRKAERILQQLHQTLIRNRTWRLRRWYEDQRPAFWIYCLALLGKHLGHLPADDDLFTGGGLIRAAGFDLDSDALGLRILRVMMGEGAIRPCGGLTELASNDPAELESMEFELTEKTIEFLGLSTCTVKRRRGEFVPREPNVRLDQLVLPAVVRRALDRVFVHVRHAGLLLDGWGLRGLIPYGHAPVLLFSGPPGTGKTATAEALASELNKPILVADYSRIQNSFVGQTEKNIARVFREAQSHGAVLFWDEADAMFYDRDTAQRSWEVRTVNVLLQELEHFEGVCILATNRKLSLDKAIQRRISIRIEFARPDYQQRHGIWEKLIPRQMPIAADVDCEALARYDLSGAEIKNAVLNAARLALQKGQHNMVTMRDFEEAIGAETEGHWTGKQRDKIGFGCIATS